jgi:hypothetical protein
METAMFTRMAHLLQQLLADSQVHLACCLILPDFGHNDDQVDVACGIKGTHVSHKVPAGCCC